MYLPVDDMWHSKARPVISEVVGSFVVRRWLNDRQILTYTAQGEANKATLDAWGSSLEATLIDWLPDTPHLSLHQLPLHVDLLPYLREWMDTLEATSAHLPGRMAVVAPPELALLVLDVIEHPCLETGVFPTYNAALKWLQAAL